MQKKLFSIIEGIDDMVYKVEKTISHLICLILEKTKNGNEVIDSVPFREFLRSLEIFISLKLREKYTGWEYESLDGIYASQILEMGQNQIGFEGMCILVSDQSLIPISVHIKVSDSSSEIEQMNCKLGELGENGLMKIPYDSNLWKKQMYVRNFDSINWRYSVNYNNVNIYS